MHEHDGVDVAINDGVKVRRPSGIRRVLGLGAACVAVAALVQVGVQGSAYHSHVAVLTFFAIVLAVSLRPLLIAGEASFCHGTFYALGAYTVAILTTRYDVPVLLGFLAAGCVAMLASVVIGFPSLRTSGAYFFLMTFGFLVVINSMIQHATGITGGFSGIGGIPSPPLVNGLTGFYVAAALLAAVTVVVFSVLDRSRWGLELRAIGESPELAQSAGASRFGNMLGAFAVGAFFSGVVGALYATYLSFISPSSFTFWISVYALTAVIIGGTRYLMGPVVGAAVFNAIPVAGDWSEAYVGIFAAATTLTILLLTPRGLVFEADRLLSRLGAATGGSKLDRKVQAHVGASRSNAAYTPRPRSTRQPAAGPREPVLSLVGVGKAFGGLDALTDVSFDVSPGQTLGIMGPNGAGKTTLFNIISGFDTPTRGRVLLEGRDITGVAPHKIVGLGLSRTFQATTVFDALTVFENVLLASQPQRQSRAARCLNPLWRDDEAMGHAAHMLDLFDLTSWAADEAARLPYGVRKTLGVAVAMATQPTILCLDEPMAGLADVEAERMCETLERLKSENPSLAMVFVEHRVSVMRRLCDRLVALDFGVVLATGTPDEVTSHPEVVRAYLGEPEVMQGA